MEVFGYIYKHTNKINKKVYIGQTTEVPERRWRKGDKNYNSYKTCAAFYPALLKYTWSAFDSEVLVRASNQETLNKLEEFYIKEYNSLAPNGYNTKEISDGRGKQAESTKEKISVKRQEYISKKGYLGPAANRKEHIFIDDKEYKECAGVQRDTHLEEINNFGKNNRTWDKKHHYCKDCWKLYIKEQRKRNPPKRLTKEEWDASYIDRKKSDIKYDARKCEIKLVDADTYRRFTNANHRQKYAPAKVIYGLYFNNYLIAIMSFGKPRFNDKYEWELIRFCSIKRSRVRGGASKLLDFFVKQHHPRSMVTYANKAYSNGDLYKILEFTYMGDGAPNYEYIRDAEIVSRYQAQKHKLAKLLKAGFDPKLTEVENMEKNGFTKHYLDASMIFIKEWSVYEQKETGPKDPVTIKE
jgi:group I intron endonuclease